MKGKMATSVFTLLLLIVCCVGSTVAEVEAPSGAGKVKKENMATDTNSSETDIVPPPSDEQFDAKLEDLNVRLGKVRKENDTNSSETDIMPPPSDEQFDAKLEDLNVRLGKVRKENGTNSSETDVVPPPSDEQFDAKLEDLNVRLGKVRKESDTNSSETDIQPPPSNFRQTLDKRGQDVVDFLTCEIESLEQLKAMASKLYCMNGQKVPRDCQDAYTAGLRRSGVYTVSPDGVKRFKAYCDQDVDGGGWTVFQSRMDVSKKYKVDFYRKWADYKQGFGNASGECWLGNDHINMMTAKNDQKLRVELEYKRETRYAAYTSFSIGNEAAKYKLTVSGYSGNAGDSLTYHNGCSFSTSDRDNDAYGSSCAQYASGAWWYRSCYYSNLNGLYGTNGTKGVTWSRWKGSISLSRARMMFKPR